MSVKSVIIAGSSFDLQSPYAEGHTLNAAEAHVLNQVRHENVRNNTAKKVKDATSPEEAAAFVAKYDAEYVFSISSGSSTVKLDPIEREARKIATQIVSAHLATTGRSIRKVPAGITKEEWEAKIEANVSTIAAKEDVLKEAKKIVSAQQKRIESLSSGISLD